MNAVLLRPLPFPEADRIVFYMSTGPNGPGFPGASPAKFAHFQQQSQVTELASAFNSYLVNYTDGSFPEQLRGGHVSADFFPLFGAQTVMGRTFSADEDRPRGDKVAIVGKAFWQDRLKSDPEILGKGISLGSVPAIGIYGLMAYSVEQRTQEIGIRLSLGADGGSVRRMVIVQGMRLAVVGVIAGLAASWGLAQFMASFLYEVQARDPLVFVGVPVLLTVVAFFAVFLPALRASKVDPIVALRYE